MISQVVEVLSLQAFHYSTREAELHQSLEIVETQGRVTAGSDLAVAQEPESSCTAVGMEASPTEIQYSKKGTCCFGIDARSDRVYPCGDSSYGLHRVSTGNRPVASNKFPVNRMNIVIH